MVCPDCDSDSLPDKYGFISCTECFGRFTRSVDMGIKSRGPLLQPMIRKRVQPGVRVVKTGRINLADHCAHCLLPIVFHSSALCRFVDGFFRIKKYEKVQFLNPETDKPDWTIEEFWERVPRMSTGRLCRSCYLTPSLRAKDITDNGPVRSERSTGGVTRNERGYGEK